MQTLFKKLEGLTKLNVKKKIKKPLYFLSINSLIKLHIEETSQKTDIRYDLGGLLRGGETWMNEWTMTFIDKVKEEKRLSQAGE